MEWYSYINIWINIYKNVWKFCMIYILEKENLQKEKETQNNKVNK